MMRNPVFSHEVKVNFRSVRLPVITLLFNGILSLVTFLNMYSAVAQARTTAAIQYSSLMDMHGFVTTIEFILLMSIVPTVTVSSISGERERQTLELVLTIQMTAFQVVIGKPVSALSTLLLPTVPSFLAVTMVFVYGGTAWGDVVPLLLCYVIVAFFVGSVGLCFSALFKRFTVSMVATYGVLVAVVAETYFINKLTLPLPSMNINNLVAVYGFGGNAVEATSGGAFYLSLLNPAATFLVTLNGQVGGSASLTKVRSYLGMTTTNSIMNDWIMVSILIQLALAILMIHIAVRCVEPVEHRRKNDKKGVSHGNY